MTINLILRFLFGHVNFGYYEYTTINDLSEVVFEELPQSFSNID